VVATLFFEAPGRGGRLGPVMMPTADDPLIRLTDAPFARPLPNALRVARNDVQTTIQILATIPDASLAVPWAWKGGREKIRYGFYRIGEVYELAAIDTTAASRS